MRVSFINRLAAGVTMGPCTTFRSQTNRIGKSTIIPASGARYTLFPQLSKHLQLEQLGSAYFDFIFDQQELKCTFVV